MLDDRAETASFREHTLYRMIRVHLAMWLQSQDFEH